MHKVTIQKSIYSCAHRSIVPFTTVHLRKRRMFHCRSLFAHRLNVPLPLTFCAPIECFTAVHFLCIGQLFQCRSLPAHVFECSTVVHFLRIGCMFHCSVLFLPIGWMFHCHSLSAHRSIVPLSITFCALVECSTAVHILLISRSFHCCSLATHLSTFFTAILFLSSWRMFHYRLSARWLNVPLPFTSCSSVECSIAVHSLLIGWMFHCRPLPAHLRNCRMLYFRSLSAHQSNVPLPFTSFASVECSTAVYFPLISWMFHCRSLSAHRLIVPMPFTSCASVFYFTAGHFLCNCRMFYCRSLSAHRSNVPLPLSFRLSVWCSTVGYFLCIGWMFHCHSLSANWSNVQLPFSLPVMYSINR
jgi:hypothetical protein